MIGSVILVMLSLACMPRGPVIGGSKSPDVGGTIAGTVRTSGSSFLTGRRVTATDVASGAKFETSTAANGGYTMKVPRGKYRLEVELRPGEVLEEQPAETEINASDLDPRRNFVITVKSGL
jgi:Carboxypeptidase regulatory-like domain